MPRVGIREQQKTFPVTVLCKVMQVSTSAFYAWSKTPEDTDKKLLEKQLEGKAVQLFEENRKTYGSRRLSEAFINLKTAVEPSKWVGCGNRSCFDKLSTNGFHTLQLIFAASLPFSLRFQVCLRFYSS